MTFEFNEERHEYTVNGKPVPSVTQVIGEAYPFQWDSEAANVARDFGTALHKTLSLRDSGQLLHWDRQLDPWIAGWTKFIEDYSHITRGVLIVDIKTGAFSPTWHIQTSAYHNLWSENAKGLNYPVNEEYYYSTKYGYAGTVDRIFKYGAGPARALCVQINQGEYKPYKSKNTLALDFNIFLSMLNIWKWKKQNNLLKKEIKS